MKKVVILILAVLLSGCARKNTRIAVQPTPEMLIYPKPTPTASPIILDGVNYGQYGRQVITNAGTENQLTYIGYFLPPGLYRAVNEKDLPDGLLIYSSATIWEGGIEYPAYTNVYQFKQLGETQVINMPDGYYIKVIPPVTFSLTPVR